MPRKAQSDRWIQLLAEPYLRGYRAVPERNGDLRGYRFFADSPTRSRMRCGFFVGYLLRTTGFKSLQAECPACIVFAFVEPVGGAAHRRLVAADGSLFRQTWNYIRWLTHRPPRFVFFEDQNEVLVRHISVREWPKRKLQHYSRNFFIETLAWLVRSGLAKKLPASPTERQDGAVLQQTG